jgi:hypothetical protein
MACSSIQHIGAEYVSESFNMFGINVDMNVSRLSSYRAVNKNTNRTVLFREIVAVILRIKYNVVVKCTVSVCKHRWYIQ